MLLADENQRINTENSTIKKIERAHHLVGDNIYFLKENYRNTKEIAQVAAHFYTGLRTGIPKLPKKSGNVPTLVRTRNKTDVVERIAKYARLNSQQEIGVLVPYHRTRKRLYKMLEEELGDGHKVQTYTSNRTELENLGMTAQELRDSLTFNKPGVISVLCYASSKGLEFDSVFLPELQTLRVGAENNDTIRMQLYVMCSRARSRLTLMMTEGRGRSPVNDLLPPPPILKEEGA
jgi:DNA helicase IV